MSNNLFLGQFIKSKGYSAVAYRKKDKIGIPFDETLYKKAEDDIVGVLGRNAKYTIFDAARFFQTKYEAVRIPWKYMMHYNDTTDHRLEHYVESTLADDEMAPFGYNTSKENNITLVIDTAFNRTIRNNYKTTIEDFEYGVKRQKELAKDMPFLRIYGHSNPIITIGTLDNSTINSMVKFNGVYLDDQENAKEIIPEIEYELWYFYKHS